MKKFYFIFILIGIFLSKSIFSQNLKIGIEGGPYFFVGTSVYNNEMSGFGTDNKFSHYAVPSSIYGLGFGNNFNLGLKIKYEISKINFSILCNLKYVSFRGEGKINASPPWSSMMYYPNVESRSDLYGIGVGIEYCLSKSSVNPYISGELNFTHFNKTILESVKTTTTYKQTLASKTRFGASLGFGLEYPIFSKLLLDFIVKFSSLSLLGRNSNEDNMNLFFTNVAISYSFSL